MASKHSLVLLGAICLSATALVGCDGDAKPVPDSGVGLIILEEGQSIDDVLSFRLYELADYDVGIYSQNATVTVSGLQRYKQ